jgi:hypothetical protein
MGSVTYAFDVAGAIGSVPGTTFALRFPAHAASAADVTAFAGNEGLITAKTK